MTRQQKLYSMAIVGVLLLALAVFAISQFTGGGNEVATGGKEKEASAQAAKVELSPEAREEFAVMGEELSVISEALAEDDFSQALKTAEPLSRSLKRLAAEAPGLDAVEDELDKLSQRAFQLTKAEDLEGAREIFPQLSQGMIGILSLDPELKQRFHVYECPMVEGFNKWLQSSEGLKNPYMGKSMQSCGSESQWPGVAAAVSAVGGGEEHMHDDGELSHWTCPMHPSVKQDGPGACPICGMDLIPVTKAEVESGIVRFDAQRLQKIGVRTTTIDRRSLVVPVRTVGKVTYDEAKLEDVNLKFDGYIGKLHVAETGQYVKKGEPLFSIYSPALYSAQQEYLQALKSQQQAQGSGDPNRANYLVKIAEQKLRLWDISPWQLKQIAERGEPIENLPILSPIAGHVIEKNIVEGASVKAGERLYRIAKLDRVWINAELYESDLPLVKVGQKATITLPYQKGERVGEITHINPYLEGSKRTATARIEVPNPDLDLKPEMYANVEIEVNRGESIVVPEEAIIYTGPRRLVFLDLGEGRLKPQPIKVGTKTQGYFEVLEGLSEGDKVVTSGNFLVGAESRLKSAAKHWSGDEDAAE